MWPTIIPPSTQAVFLVPLDIHLWDHDARLSRLRRRPDGPQADGQDGGGEDDRQEEGLRQEEAELASIQILSLRSRGAGQRKLSNQTEASWTIKLTFFYFKHFYPHDFKCIIKWAAVTAEPGSCGFSVLYSLY